MSTTPKPVLNPWKKNPTATPTTPTKSGSPVGLVRTASGRLSAPLPQALSPSAASPLSRTNAYNTHYNDRSKVPANNDDHPQHQRHHHGDYSSDAKYISYKGSNDDPDNYNDDYDDYDDNKANDGNEATAKSPLDNLPNTLSYNLFRKIVDTSAKSPETKALHLQSLVSTPTHHTTPSSGARKNNYSAPVTPSRGHVFIDVLGPVHDRPKTPVKLTDSDDEAPSAFVPSMLNSLF